MTDKQIITELRDALIVSDELLDTAMETIKLLRQMLRDNKQAHMDNVNVVNAYVRALGGTHDNN